MILKKMKVELPQSAKTVKIKAVKNPSEKKKSEDGI